MKDTLLIIGGTGFFGLSLLDYLKNKKNNYSKIIIISRSKKKFLNDYKKLKIEFRKNDINNLKKLPKCNNIIYMITNKNYKKDILYFQKFTKLLLNSKYKGNLLYTSSGAIYKYLNKHKNLNYKYLNYAKAKIENEKLIKAISSHNIKCVIVRCFTFVGKNLPLNGKYIIGNIINSVIHSKKISINNGGKIIRSFMHADDLSKFLLGALTNASKNCPTYNLGSNDNINLKDFAYLLSKKFNLELQVKNKFKKNDIYSPIFHNNKFIKNLYSKKTSYNAILKTIKQLEPHK